MDIRGIVSELKSERNRINQAIATLEGLSGGANHRDGAAHRRVSVRHAAPTRKRRSHLTAEGRRKLSQLMKRRWAERRKKAQ